MEQDFTSARGGEDDGSTGLSESSELEFRRRTFLSATVTHAVCVIAMYALSTHRHSIAVATLSLLVAAASVVGLRASSPGVLMIIILAIALVGVPHGGLDHWVGQLLLHRRLKRWWAPVFFGSYLGVMLLVVAGWLTVPFITAIGFFLVSAWHFGLEDDRPEFTPAWLNHVTAIAVGGLVIWIPAVTMPDRMGEILQSIIPPAIADASRILEATRLLAFCLVPLAFIVSWIDWRAGEVSRVARNVALAFSFAIADPLLSFVVYFCGWHSLRGLYALAIRHRKTFTQLAVATSPLTIGTVMIAVCGWTLLHGTQTVSDSMIRILFISLSAIAVPHLFLHGPVTRWLREHSATTASAMDQEVAR